MLFNLITLSWIFSLVFYSFKTSLIFSIHTFNSNFISSMVLGNLNINFWFSYILFLIMIGGMLVLFIYMTSIASDEKFKFSKTTSILLLMYIMFNMIIMFKDEFFSYLDTFNSNFLNMNFKEINLSLSKFTNIPNWLIFFILICYLLITLIVVVKIAYKKNGTLRPWLM
uniref:NADH-ubiquinone oxidoreductase chain 6 n=1 Tax=Myllocerinus aurolineatus TaxID=2527849 RepID=A0A411LVY0_9CUCU|nr:NADH dehydrogenase subunit 6 [Myllocerinus aurolineatus]QBF03601.1 NADH dehydrogenase subunit 6 [Myllocerinus aurolineatus]